MGSVGGVALAVAVADAGGLGMLSGVSLAADVLRAQLVEARDSTAGVVGVNFLMPFLDPAVVPVAAAAASYLEFFYGPPDPALVSVAHDHGAMVGWQVGTAADAASAVEAGCDVVIVQGMEAGGHVVGRTSLWALLDEVAGQLPVPVVAAGGLGSRAAVRAAMAAGADAVRVGTRFVAAVEADAHASYQQALIGASAADTELTTAFGVFWPDAPHRVLRSSITTAAALDDEIVGMSGEVPVPRFSPLPPKRDATGHVAAMALYAGLSVDSVVELATAEDIINELLGPDSVG